MKGMAKKESILIIDDDESTCRTLKLIFDKKGFDTDTARSGEEAKDKLRKRFFNMALLDIRLPDMNGINLIPSLLENHPDMAVLIITGFASIESAVRAMKMGAVAYIIKPLNIDEVLVTCEGEFEKQRLIAENLKIEEALRKSEAKYQDLFNSAPVAYFSVGIDGKIKNANKAAVNLLGYNIDELKDMMVLDLYVEESKEKAKQLFKIFLRGEQLKNIEMIYKRKDGQKVNGLLSVSPIKDKNDRILESRSIVVNITDRKRAEQLMMEKARDEIYSFLASSLPVFASNIHPHIRNTLIGTFAKRFEENMKPRFEKELLALDLDFDYLNNVMKEPEKLIEAYFSWISNLFTNFGIQAKSKIEDFGAKLELQSCPWAKEAKGNPIFCFMCRAMVVRSFTWVCPKGNTTQESSIADGSEFCRFIFQFNTLNQSIGDNGE